MRSPNRNNNSADQARNSRGQYTRDRGSRGDQAVVTPSPTPPSVTRTRPSNVTRPAAGNRRR